MSIHMNIHDVISINLVTRSRENANFREIRIVTRDHEGKFVKLDIRMFGKTADLEALPKASNFVDYDNIEQAETDA